MKFHIRVFLRYLLLFLFASPLLMLISYFTGIIYRAAAELIPSVLPLYDPISNKENYAVQETVLALISAFITIYILSYLAVNFDNRKFEFLIERTDGFYTLKDGCRIYLGEYLLSDAISSAAVPLIFTAAELAIPVLPNRLGLLNDLIDRFFEIELLYTGSLGVIAGIALISLSSFAVRMMVIPISIASWRSLWLSDIGR